MEVKASLNKYGKSAKKIRGIIPILRGVSVSEAAFQLGNLMKGHAGDLRKLLASAVANAKNSYNLKEEDLIVKDLIVEEKPMMKRWMPKAYGRATQILKRTSRVEIILEETAEARKTREAGKRKKIEQVKSTGKEETAKKTGGEEKLKVELKDKIGEDKKEKQRMKIEDKRKIGKLPGAVSQVKKIFRRKSI